MTKRARDTETDLSLERKRKIAKQSHVIILPDDINNIVIEYVIDNPFEEFVNICVDGNQDVAEWLQNNFRFDTMGIERLLQLRFTHRISLTKSETIFKWYKNTFGVNYRPIECAAVAIDNDNTNYKKYIKDITEDGP